VASSSLAARVEALEAEVAELREQLATFRDEQRIRSAALPPA
jgi:uncharacterized protein YceH (UPF0502 family)